MCCGDPHAINFGNSAGIEAAFGFPLLHRQLTCISDLTGSQGTSFPVGHLFRLVQGPPQDLLDEQTEAFLSRVFTNHHLFGARLSPVAFTALNLSRDESQLYKKATNV